MTELAPRSEDTNSIVIIQDGIPIPIRYASSMEELDRVKQFDDEMFGIHQGISITELIHIMEYGYVFIIYNAEGEIVAESQILLAPIEEHSNLDNDEAYCYGTAIHPPLQGTGTAQLLFAAQEQIARRTGKKKMTLTVRPENASSIRARLKQGFIINGYNPECYGAFDEGGGRFLMMKRLDDSSEPFDSLVDASLVRANPPLIITDEAHLDALTVARRALIPITVGDAVDIPAQRLIYRAFQLGFVGTAFFKPDEIAYERCAILFERHI